MPSSESKAAAGSAAEAVPGDGDWVISFDAERADDEKTEIVPTSRGRSAGEGQGARVSMDLQDLGRLVAQTLPMGGAAPEPRGKAKKGELGSSTRVLPSPEATQADPTEADSDQTHIDPEGFVPGAFGKSKRIEGFKLNAGTKVHKYELVRLLGKGGMGTVWAAYDTKLGRKVAIKFLHRKASQKKEFRERFLAEARATAQFNHENIVTIHDAGEYGGLSYLVLEYLEGESLSERLKASTLTHQQAVQTMIPVVRALVEAHALGIVHRDLKPANIFITRAGNIKVLDFGLAKLFAGDLPESSDAKPSLEAMQRHLDAREGEEEDSNVSGVSSSGTGALTAVTSGRRQLHDSETDLTEVGAIMGTYAFMSPEQWGIGAIDHQTDLWAVGIILFRIISGEHPFGSKATRNIMAHIMRLHEPVQSIRDVVGEVPDDVADIVASCLQKKKEERIESAEALLERLESVSAAFTGRAKLKPDENPYLGLAAFTEKDANRFFGRDEEIAQFISKLKDWPTLAVVGPSGNGKSSFVRAGVIPTLRSGDADWDVILCRPGRSPFAAIAGAIHAAHSTNVTSVKEVSEAAKEEAELAAHLEDEPGHLGAVLRARARGNGRPLLLYVDQFEELYTMVENPEVRLRFARALAGVAVDATTPVRVVLTMRSDFLDRVVECPELTTAISHELTVLRQPGPAGLRDAIVQPAAMAGYQFETDVTVDEMIHSLESETAALPLLQFTAQKLWEARDKKKKQLSHKAYMEMGGVEGALVRHADAVVERMTPTERNATKRLFQRLVTPENTRAILSQGELASLFDDDRLAANIIQLLTEARLLTVSTHADDEAESRVEIVHESLIGRWQKLRRWLDEGNEDRAMLDQLHQASQQWQLRERPTGLLWSGEAIEEARLWRRRSSAKLTPVEDAFLGEGFKLADRAANRKRLLTTVTIVVLAAVALGAVLSMLKIRESGQRAQRESERAKKERKRAVLEADRARAAESEAKRNLLTATKATREARAAADKEKKAKALATKRFDQYKASVAREEMTQGELKQSYKDLKKSLEVAKKAKRAAENAQRTAETAKSRAQRLAADLKVRLDAERAENRRLRKMRVKLIQSLPVRRRPRPRP